MMRITDKINELKEFLEELNEFMPSSIEEYSEPKTKAACERYFEKIIEAAVDLCFLVIKENRFKTPEDDKNAFDILFQEKIISENLAEKLKQAKGMRNILAHEYGSIDDELVFEALTKQIREDVKELIEHVQKLNKSR